MDNRDHNRFPAASGASAWLAIDSLAPGAKRIGGLVLHSPEMREVLTRLERISWYGNTVLIRGESGTGKELIAEQLHARGPAAGGPFITFNCSNLIESLAESTLFGHVRGAFTDAREDSAGYFREAQGGTLFLDEIGELPPQLQPKLLRAVELREVQPIGSTKSVSLNVRLITATNRDLGAMVKAGQFRQDLYYRLAETTFFIPPLRERRADIEALTSHFVTHYNRLFAKGIRFISSRTITALRDYEWPGNVRELSNTIQSAVLQTDGDRLDIVCLPQHIASSASVDIFEQPIQLRRESSEAPVASNDDEATPFFLLDSVIKNTLMRSLHETEGNRRQAARLLGISRSTLYRMLKRYQLPPDQNGP